MPTRANCVVVGHLYAQPEAIEGGQRPGASFRLWTSDRPKKDAGKVFTYYRGAVWGPQAEWLLRDGKKGSLVMVSGTFRLEEFDRKDGTKGHTIEIRASEALILDRVEHDQHGAEAAPAQAPQKPQRPAPVGDDDGSPPF